MDLARRPSPALVVSFVALFSSLAGAATAAKLVTGKQIAKKTITGKNVKPKSLTGKHVKDGSLLAAAFKKGQLPAAGAGGVGPAGPEGARGPEGPRGVEGARGVDGVRGPDGPRGADGANGKDGAAGAVGPQGPAGAAGPQGPAGGNVIASGFHTLSASLNLASGSNDFFAPAFTASNDGVCVVTAQVSVDNQGAAANATAGLQAVRKVNSGAAASDGGWTSYVMADGDSEGSASKTATFAIAAGSSYEFGVRVFAAGDSVGDFAFPTVTYFCL
jgi:hypothetical protein